MVNEMQVFIHQYTAQILPPIWQLLTQTAGVYVKVVVNELEPELFTNNDDGKMLNSIKLNHSSKIFKTYQFFFFILRGVRKLVFTVSN